MKHERVMGVRKSRRLIEAAQNLEMDGQDWISHLPSEILMNILLKLPPGDIMRCKSVCKPLLELLVSPEFVKSHLSKAVPGLAIYEWDAQAPSYAYKIVEFVENLDLNNDKHRWGIVLNFKLPSNYKPVHSSANGLLLLRKYGYGASAPILCNSLTSDYIKLPYPYRSSSYPKCILETYGFGVSRISCQYKVVRMSMEREFDSPVQLNLDVFECQVYTVGSGTGTWRRIDNTGSRFRYDGSTVGAFVKGNLHWLTIVVSQSKPQCQWISCIDLETERLSSFSVPPCVPGLCRHLSVLGDCLCLCDNGDEYTGGDKIVIWLMKEYGDDKSWTKEFVIQKGCDTTFLGHIRPIKVFEDGDILMNWANLLYYSNKTKTIREMNVYGVDHNKDHNRAVVYSPSFVSLRTFAMENVISPSDLERET